MAPAECVAVPQEPSLACFLVLVPAGNGVGRFIYSIYQLPYKLVIASFGRRFKRSGWGPHLVGALVKAPGANLAGGERTVQGVIVAVRVVQQIVRVQLSIPGRLRHHLRVQVHVLDARIVHGQGERIHLLHPAPLSAGVGIFEDGEAEVHPHGRHCPQVVERHHRWGVAHRCDALSLLQGEGPSEFLSDMPELFFGRLYVEKGKCRRTGCPHEVGHGAQPQMIRLRHEDKALFDGCLLGPLHEGVWAVDDDVGTFVWVFRQRLGDEGGNLLH
mmetsp:Transcript_15231/g.45969  ORF Transcript_15231/g.45969 Transcript_15231/m.45969 type:complete len:272 (+) Transcript_15231:333-1148(+)